MIQNRGYLVELKYSPTRKGKSAHETYFLHRKLDMYVNYEFVQMQTLCFSEKSQHLCSLGMKMSLIFQQDHETQWRQSHLLS